MKRDLYLRRQLILDLHYRGLMSVKTVTTLATKFNVKPKTLWTDWTRRNLWIPELAQIKQTQEQLYEVFAEFKRLRQEAWKIYTDAKNLDKQSSATGALSLIMTSIVKEAELKQSLGLMEKMPLKIQQELRHIVESRPVIDMDSLKEDERDALIKVAEIMERRAKEKKRKAEFEASS